MSESLVNATSDPSAPAPAHLLASARLYLCMDGCGLDVKGFHALVSRLFEAGVDIIQLRDKRMEAAQELAYFAALREAAAQHGALFAANDRADIAHLAQAHVLHLGQGDLPLAQARTLLPAGVLLGQSTHSVSQAEQAMRSIADYYCIGPVWPTATKPGRAAVGVAVVREVAETAARVAPQKPWFAIGDIRLDNLADLRDAGVRRVVVVRAITEAADPAEAAAALKRQLAG